MARIPYKEITPDLQPLADAVKAGRGEVNHLYRMLMHSPPVAQGWLAYLTAIRHEGLLPAALRELLIMRVAVLNHAPYEAEQHGPIALKNGLTQAQLDALDEWTESKLFDQKQRAVLALADSMTRDVHVADDLFKAVQNELDDRMLVEAVATIAAYNMVSRFLVAFQIDTEKA